MGVSGAEFLVLSWTIPERMGVRIGRGGMILVRSSPLTEANWAGATQVRGEPPSDVGDSQSFTISGLNPGTTYYVGTRRATTGTTVSALSISSRHHDKHGQSRRCLPSVTVAG